jgi:hypothetical protein
MIVIKIMSENDLEEKSSIWKAIQELQSRLTKEETHSHPVPFEEIGKLLSRVETLEKCLKHVESKLSFVEARMNKYKSFLG